MDSQQAALDSRKAQAHTATALEFDDAMQPGTPIGYSSGGAERPTNRTEVERLGQKDAGSNKVPTVQVISPDTVSHVGLRSPAETDVTAIHTPRPGADEMDDQVMEEQGDNTGGNLSSVTQRASEMLTQAQETGKRAMRVTVERVQEMLGAAKEAVGIDKDKPIGDATREAASTVSQKVQSSIEQAMANMNITASQAAGGVVTAPTAVQDFYKHGRRLVEEKEKEKEKGKGKGKEKESEGSGERGAPHEVTDPIMDIPIEDATAAVPSQGKSDQMVSSATWPQA